MTKTACRAKNPKTCPHHGAPATIASLQQKLSEGGSLNQAEVQEFMEAHTIVQEASKKRERVLALLNTPTRRDGSKMKLPAEAVEIISNEVSELDNEEDVAAMYKACLPHMKDNDFGTAFINHPLLPKEAREHLIRTLPFEKLGSAIYAADNQKVLQQYLALADETQGYNGRPKGGAHRVYEALIYNSNVSAEDKEAILDKHPGFVNLYVQKEGWNATAEKATVAFLAGKNADTDASIGYVQNAIPRAHQNLTGFGTRENALGLFDKLSEPAPHGVKRLATGLVSASLAGNRNVSFQDLRERALSVTDNGWGGTARALLTKKDLPATSRAVLEDDREMYWAQPGDPAQMKRWQALAENRTEVGFLGDDPTFQLAVGETYATAQADAHAHKQLAYYTEKAERDRAKSSEVTTNERKERYWRQVTTAADAWRSTQKVQAALLA